MALKVLVTGFGPFPGVRVNPSAALATRLGGRRDLAGHGADIRAEVLATRYDEVGARLPALATTAELILMIGVAGRETMLRVEERGVAHQSRTAPDAGGKAGAAPKARGPRIWRTTAPVAACVTALRMRGLKARRSIDAGRYLCNTGYLTALRAARRGAIVLFVHVPMPAPPNGTRPRARAGPRMPRLKEMERGLAAVVKELVRAARQRQRSS